MIIISLSNIWGNVWPYLVAILLFIILIIVHEFGHFIAAKSVGVKVNEFAVGFGPKLLKKKIGETTYALNLVPLGGYCAMEGEDSGSTDSRAFCNKSPWRRFVVTVMGAAFNLLLGFILVAIILAPEENFATAKVAEFKENPTSQSTGLKVDDEIIRVDGRKIYTTYDLSYAFTNVKDGKIDITVLRNGKKKLLKDVKFETTVYEGISYLNVDFYVYPLQKTVGTYIGQTFKTCVSYCAVIYRSLFDLLGGKYGISAVSGPVGITATIGSVAKQNLASLLPIMALISINLGLFNLLPIPALDGGRIVFILIEMIIRKPVPKKYESWIHAAGFFIIMSLMLIIMAKDIWTLFIK